MIDCWSICKSVSCIIVKLMHTSFRPFVVAKYSDFHWILIHSWMYIAFFKSLMLNTCKKTLIFTLLFIINFRRVWRNLVNMKFCQFQIQATSERYVLRCCFGLPLPSKSTVWLAFIQFSHFQCHQLHPANSFSASYLNSLQGDLTMEFLDGNWAVQNGAFAVDYSSWK